MSILCRGRAAPASVALIDGRPARGRATGFAIGCRRRAPPSRPDGRCGRYPSRAHGRRLPCATRKFCSTSRIVTPVRLISLRHSISAPMIAGARPLVGSSISKQAARLDDGAGDRQHLLLAARQRARARQPEFLQRREEAENPFEPGVVERPVARGEHEIFLDAEIGKHRHRLRHIGDAGARDGGGVAARRSARRRA